MNFTILLGNLPPGFHLMAGMSLLVLILSLLLGILCCLKRQPSRLDNRKKSRLAQNRHKTLSPKQIAVKLADQPDSRIGVDYNFGQRSSSGQDESIQLHIPPGTTVLNTDSVGPSPKRFSQMSNPINPIIQMNIDGANRYNGIPMMDRRNGFFPNGQIGQNCTYIKADCLERERNPMDMDFYSGVTLPVQYCDRHKPFMESLNIQENSPLGGSDVNAENELLPLRALDLTLSCPTKPKNREFKETVVDTRPTMSTNNYNRMSSSPGPGNFSTLRMFPQTKWPRQENSQFNSATLSRNSQSTAAVYCACPPTTIIDYPGYSNPILGLTNSGASQNSNTIDVRQNQMNSCKNTETGRNKFNTLAKINVNWADSNCICENQKADRIPSTFRAEDSGDSDSGCQQVNPLGDTRGLAFQFPGPKPPSPSPPQTNSSVSVENNSQIVPNLNSLSAPTSSIPLNSGISAFSGISPAMNLLANMKHLEEQTTKRTVEPLSQSHSNQHSNAPSILKFRAENPAEKQTRSTADTLPSSPSNSSIPMSTV